MTTHDDLSIKIVDCAVQLASKSSWESLRLHDIAEELEITLAEMACHFAEKEQISDAWFDRADWNMLNAMQSVSFSSLSVQQKFYQLMMAWLEPLALNHRVTRQMILNKLEPGHLHIQIPALLRISRTVQWLREAADQKSTLPRRALDESVLTTIYVTTFCCWLTEHDPLFQRTKRWLESQLTFASRFGFLK